MKPLRFLAGLPWLAMSCFLPICPAPTQAQVAAKPVSFADLTLEQLMEIRIEKVFGASKYDQKVTRAPAAVTIVTGDEIAKFGHRTLADVLRSVRGMYVSNDSNYSYLGMRGFLRPGDYNMRTLVTVDGHRMNDNVYDAAYFGRENMLDIEAIDRVEIIRGPSSSIYGSSAFFGVINIVPKHGASLNGTEVTAEAGSHGTQQGRVAWGRKLAGDLDVLLSASWYQSDGRRHIYYPELDPRRSTDSRAINNGVAENSDGERAFRLSGRATYRDFSFSGFYSTRQKTVPTASFLGAFNTGLQKTWDHRGYLDFQYRHEFSSIFELRGRAFYDSYSYFGDYPANWAAPGDPPDIVLNRDHTLGEWVGTEWALTARLSDRHTVVTGLELRGNLHQQQVNYDDVQPRSYSINDDRSNQNHGAYLQDEFGLTANLLLNAGLRYDLYPDGFGGTLNPRLGLIYQPREQTTAKLLYGRAFRAPNAYERFFYAANMPAELRPETIRTYEAVLEHYFARDYRASLSAYQYRVDDLIEQLALPDGKLYFGNAAFAKTHGVELEIQGKYASGWEVRASYAQQRAKGTNGQRLTNSPHDLAKLNLLAPLIRDRLIAGLELQYQGSVLTLANQRAGGFTLGNLTLTAHRLAPGLDISASLYNIFGTRYGYPGAEEHTQDILPQEGRTFRLNATYRF